MHGYFINSKWVLRSWKYSVTKYSLDGANAHPLCAAASINANMQLHSPRGNSPQSPFSLLNETGQNSLMPNACCLLVLSHTMLSNKNSTTHTSQQNDNKKGFLAVE